MNPDDERIPYPICYTPDWARFNLPLPVPTMRSILNKQMKAGRSCTDARWSAYEHALQMLDRHHAHDLEVDVLTVYDYLIAGARKYGWFAGRAAQRPYPGIPRPFVPTE